MPTVVQLNVDVEDSDDDDDDHAVDVAVLVGKVLIVWLTAVVALLSLLENRFDLPPTVKEF